MLEYVEEAERPYLYWEDPIGIGACSLIFGIVCRLTGDTEQALQLFDVAYQQHVMVGYDWGMATARYFAGEVIRDLAENDPKRIPEAVEMLRDALRRFWVQGDFWRAGGAMSGLACIATQQQADYQAARYFGAADTLMSRVGGSLLPTELMTHYETADQLWERMGDVAYDGAFRDGVVDPSAAVEEALAGTREELSDAADQFQRYRLTSRQLSIVRDLVLWFDVDGIARRRGDRSAPPTRFSGGFASAWALRRGKKSPRSRSTTASSPPPAKNPERSFLKSSQKTDDGKGNG